MYLPEPAPEVVEDAACATPHRLLVAEDDDDFANVLVGLVEADPRLEVVARARDGGEAVSLAQSLRPDVILMDLVVPPVDGVQAARRILVSWPGARIVTVCRSDYSELALEARVTGAVDHVRRGRVEQDLVVALMAAAALDS